MTDDRRWAVETLRELADVWERVWPLCWERDTAQPETHTSPPTPSSRPLFLEPSTAHRSYTQAQCHVAQASRLMDDGARAEGLPLFHTSLPPPSEAHRSSPLHPEVMRVGCEIVARLVERVDAEWGPVVGEVNGAWHSFPDDLRDAPRVVVPDVRWCRNCSAQGVQRPARTQGTDCQACANYRARTGRDRTVAA